MNEVINCSAQMKAKDRVEFVDEVTTILLLLKWRPRFGQSFVDKVIGCSE